MLIDSQKKEFIIEFKNYKGAEPREPLTVTRGTAELIRAFQHDPKAKVIDLYDEHGEFVECLDKSDLKGVKRIGKEWGSIVNSEIGPMVCEFGTRHPHRGKEGFEDCHCSDRFNGVSPFTFTGLLQDHFPNIHYPSDIMPATQLAMQEICRGFDAKNGYVPKCRRGVNSNLTK